MNRNMTACTQDSKIFYFIMLMTFVNMVNIKFAIYSFTNMTLVREVFKSSFSIVSRSFSIILIFLSSSFKSMKSFLFALIRTKLGFSTFFATENRATFLTSNRFFSRRMTAKFNKTFLITKSYSTFFTFRNITRSFKKLRATFFTNYFNTSVPCAFITNSRAIFRDRIFNRILTYGAIFHTLIIRLATTNVNSKQVLI